LRPSRPTRVTPRPDIDRMAVAVHRINVQRCRPGRQVHTDGLARVRGLDIVVENG
jgi:hypothetical protein